MYLMCIYRVVKTSKGFAVVHRADWALPSKRLRPFRDMVFESEEDANDICAALNRGVTPWDDASVAQ